MMYCGFNMLKSVRLASCKKNVYRIGGMLREYIAKLLIIYSANIRSKNFFTYPLRQIYRIN